jgi:hypothetical protein
MPTSSTSFPTAEPHPWLRALANDDGDPERNVRFMVTGASIDGISLLVV